MREKEFLYDWQYIKGHCCATFTAGLPGISGAGCGAGTEAEYHSDHRRRPRVAGLRFYAEFPHTEHESGQFAAESDCSDAVPGCPRRRWCGLPQWARDVERLPHLTAHSVVLRRHATVPMVRHPKCPGGPAPSYTAQ